jgi:HD-GYP domain-containing protein (c-di-GMP phosphodiesterase class II)
LYDEAADVFRMEASLGMEGVVPPALPPFPGAMYREAFDTLGGHLHITDLLSLISGPLPHWRGFRESGLDEVALAQMTHNGELIGLVVAIRNPQDAHYDEDDLALLRGVADQAALAYINTRLFKDAKRRMENLRALRDVDLAIASNQGMEVVLDQILELLVDKLGVNAAMILTFEKHSQILHSVASLGMGVDSLIDIPLAVGEGVSGKVFRDKKMRVLLDLPSEYRELKDGKLLLDLGFESFIASPLILEGQAIGVLEVMHRERLNPNQEWFDFLETLAGQIAIAIQTATMVQHLEMSREELANAYDKTIEGWSFAMDLRDEETEAHTRRVTDLTVQLSKYFFLKKDELAHIRRGALLHDIGKMGIPDQILLKKGALTEDEWVIMKKHPGFAYEMLKPIVYLRHALDIPYCHHEKWDGSGYPRGLAGEAIPLVARIFAVVDVWDALTSDRPYRKAWSREKTIAFIKEQAGQHFDPDVVAVFMSTIIEGQPAVKSIEGS